MLKINGHSGITLVTLVVTIIVMLILAGVSLNLGDNTIDETAEKISVAELSIVQQAVVQQYGKAKTSNQLNMKIGENKKPSCFLGERIDDTNTIDADGIQWVIKEYDYYEDCYYELSKNDLKALGITGSKDTYIVNYKTGEVYNASKKKTSEGKNLYKKSIEATTINGETTPVDNTFAE